MHEKLINLNLRMRKTVKKDEKYSMSTRNLNWIIWILHFLSIKLIYLSLLTTLNQQLGQVDS